jgi:hypothetical protein
MSHEVRRGATDSADEPDNDSQDVTRQENVDILAEIFAINKPAKRRFLKIHCTMRTAL